MESDDRFVVNLPLYVNPYVRKVLGVRFETARIYYNAILGEILKRRKAFRHSLAFKEGVRLLKLDQKKNAATEFSAARRDSHYYLSSGGGKNNSIEQFGAVVQKSWIGDQLDSHTCKALAGRAWGAVERLDKRLAKKVFFKRKTEPLYSVEGESRKSPLKFDTATKTVIWSGLRIPLHWQHCKDEIAIKFFELESEEYKRLINDKPSSLIKYARIKRVNVHGEWRYSLQLVIVGKPIPKDKHVRGTGIVAFDLGVRDITVVSDSVFLDDYSFVKKLAQRDVLLKKCRVLQRKIDRQRRAGNPANYDDRGRCKKGVKWHKSTRQTATEARLADMLRKDADRRRFLVGEVVNYLRSEGDRAQFENCNYKGWQKLFGKSVGLTAPGLLVEKVKQKFGADNYMEFDTQDTKFSQRCPRCDNIRKKSLSERVHNCEKCHLVLPRNIASAILAFSLSWDGKLDKKLANEMVEKYLCGQENAKVED